MALRNILTKEDQTLYKKCRPVTEFNDRLHQLLDDTADTLIKSNGVGLAAPQVGVLRRVVLVIETNVEEDEDEYIIELINPEILESWGEQYGPEGCLSVPGEFGNGHIPYFNHLAVSSPKSIQSQNTKSSIMGNSQIVNILTGNNEVLGDIS